jgi:hypothetical protein
MAKTPNICTEMPGGKTNGKMAELKLKRRLSFGMAGKPEEPSTA